MEHMTPPTLSLSVLIILTYLSTMDNKYVRALSRRVWSTGRLASTHDLVRKGRGGEGRRGKGREGEREGVTRRKGD